MKKLSDTQGQRNGFKLLQIGESGAGKTHRSLTAAAFGPVYVIDLDRKLEGYVDKLPNDTKAKILYDTPDTAAETLDCLAKARSKKAEIATLVLDTWTRWHQIAQDTHLDLNKAKRTVAESPLGAIEQLTQPDWGAIKRINYKFLMELLSLPFNIIINTHVGRAIDQMGNQVFTVGTTGSFGQEMPQFFQETHQCYIDMNGKYKVKALRSNKMVANSALRPDNFEANGNLKVEDLSVFRNIAKIVK